LGGTKKKTLASMEKTQNEEDQTPQGGSGAAKTKTKESKPVGERKRVEVLMPKMSDQDFVKNLGAQKAITIYSAARSLNVSASVAKAILSSLESKGMMSRVGGYSGHYVWAPSSISRT
jgi:small subunit ribosomal protein S25e